MLLLLLYFSVLYECIVLHTRYCTSVCFNLVSAETCSVVVALPEILLKLVGGQTETGSAQTSFSAATG